MFNPNQQLPDFQVQNAELERQRAMAAMLRRQAATRQEPQPQMVGGQYIAPHWTQHLAGLVDKAQAGYMDHKVKKGEEQYGQQVAQATQDWQSNLPQSVPGTPARPELPGPRAAGGSPELDAAEAGPATLPSREAVLKATIAGMRIPGNAENAKLWNKGMSDEMIREDNQAAKREALAATLAQQRELQREALRIREEDARRRSEDLRLGIEQRREAAAEANVTRELIQRLRNEGKSGGGGKDDNSDISEPYAKGIAEGKMPMPSPWVMRSEYGKKLMNRVLEINPEYDAATYGGRQRGITTFAAGPEGRSTRSMNVAIEHLDSLGKLADALGNTDIRVLNKAKQAYQEQFGKPAPTNFDAAKSIVGQEIVKSIVANGGSMQERQEASERIQRAASPKQLHGVIETYIDLMGGQLKGLEKQYRGSTKLDDYSDRFLTGRARQAFDKYKEVEPAPAAKGGAKLPPGLVLPPGAKYIGPAQ